METVLKPGRVAWALGALVADFLKMQACPEYSTGPPRIGIVVLGRLAQGDINPKESNEHE
jgi:hypothetical protein